MEKLFTYSAIFKFILYYAPGWKDIIMIRRQIQLGDFIIILHSNIRKFVYKFLFTDEFSIFWNSADGIF